jgi:hypothetical protein
MASNEKMEIATEPRGEVLAAATAQTLRVAVLPRRLLLGLDMRHRLG